MKVLRILAFLAMILAFFVVMLGAYTRLTNAGLGCPDWPGCYGKMVVPTQAQDQMTAQAHFPSTPLETRKAWTEMIHRYIAGSLGLLIVIIAVLSWRTRSEHSSLGIPIFLFLLLGFQAALGMWTVTLKLLPIVVMGHLLGGLSIFGGLVWLNLNLNKKIALITKKNDDVWVYLGLGILICQIALGGWVSSNYAGLACIGFPQCNGQWLPTLNWHNSFQIGSAIGLNHQGGLLDSTSRMTIQILHRFGAIVTLVYWVGLGSVFMCKYRSRTLLWVGFLVISCLLTQFSLGIINVMFMLPLWAAVAHNGMAALLLAAGLNFYFVLRQQDDFYARTN